MTNYTEIIEQYLDGEMTPQEATAFKQQIENDSDLAYEVRLQQLAVAGVQHSEEARFQQFKSRIKTIESRKKNETPVVQMKPRRSAAVQWVLRIAAVMIPLLFVYFLLPFSTNQSNPLAATTTQLVELHTTSSRGETPTPEATILDEAIQSFEQENYQASLPLLDRVISGNTHQSSAALFLKADALYRLDKKAEAKTTLEKMLNQDDEALKEKARTILDKW